MAFFSGDPINGGDKQRGFTFDIDSQGHSSASRQRKEELIERDISIINQGKHCSLDVCGQLDLLPHTCEYCEKVFCKNHAFPQQHDCFFDLTTLNLAVRCKRCDKHIKMQNITSLEQQKQVISSHLSSGCKLYVLERTSDEKQSIRNSLMCIAKGCTNHLSTGKRLSTLRCKQCNQQVCLSHRLGSSHQCRERAPTRAPPEDGKQSANRKTLWERSQAYLKSILSRTDDVEDVETIVLVSPPTIVERPPPPSPAVSCGDETAVTDPAPQLSLGASPPQAPQVLDSNSIHAPVSPAPAGQAVAPQAHIVTVASAKPVNTQRSLTMAKQKARTYPTISKIDESDKVPVILYFPEASRIPASCGKLPKICETPVYAYVSRNWSIGRCIDDITKTLKIKNNNHLASKPHIRLSDLQDTTVCYPNNTTIKDIIDQQTPDGLVSLPPQKQLAAAATVLPLHFACAWTYNA